MEIKTKMNWIDAWEEHERQWFPNDTRKFSTMEGLYNPVWSVAWAAAKGGADRDTAWADYTSPWNPKAHRKGAFYMLWRDAFDAALTGVVNVKPYNIHEFRSQWEEWDAMISMPMEAEL